MPLGGGMEQNQVRAVHVPGEVAVSRGFLGSSGRLVIVVGQRDDLKLPRGAVLVRRDHGPNLEDVVCRFGNCVLQDEQSGSTTRNVLKALQQRFRVNMGREVGEVMIGDVVAFVVPGTDEQDNLVTMSVEEIANLGWAYTYCRVAKPLGC